MEPQAAQPVDVALPDERQPSSLREWLDAFILRLLGSKGDAALRSAIKLLQEALAAEPARKASAERLAAAVDEVSQQRTEVDAESSRRDAELLLARAREREQLDRARIEPELKVRRAEERLLRRIIIAVGIALVVLVLVAVVFALAGAVPVAVISGIAAVVSGAGTKLLRDAQKDAQRRISEGEAKLTSLTNLVDATTAAVAVSDPTDRREKVNALVDEYRRRGFAG